MGGYGKGAWTWEELGWSIRSKYVVQNSQRVNKKTTTTEIKHVNIYACIHQIQNIVACFLGAVIKP